MPSVKARRLPSRSHHPPTESAWAVDASAMSSPAKEVRMGRIPVTVPGGAPSCQARDPTAARATDRDAASPSCFARIEPVVEDRLGIRHEREERTARDAAVDTFGEDAEQRASGAVVATHAVAGEHEQAAVGRDDEAGRPAQSAHQRADERPGRGIETVDRTAALAADEDRRTFVDDAARLEQAAAAARHER